MAAPNPFAPTFGSVPPVMAGRDDIVDAIREALVTGTTHPDYTTIFFGVRGAGKTVMLNAAEDVAREQGWLTISEDASRAGLTARLERAAIRHIRDLTAPPKRRVRSVQAFGIGAELGEAPPPDAAQSLREALSELGDLVADKGVGLMITLDKRFLRAMAADDGESLLADIAQRLDVDLNYAGVYRQRLIRAGMIVATTRGRVDLAHHAARQWIRDMPLDPREPPPPKLL